MKTKVALLSVLFMFLSVERVLATGPGYINICGGGTTGCGKCDVANKSCSGDFVVKFTCNGNTGSQCRDGESTFSTSQSIGNPSCGQTIQIDVFNKNCRVNGNWVCDQGETNLQDFMVWYSGDCSNPTPLPSPTPTPLGASPTPTPTPTPMPTPTPTPTPTPVPGTPNYCGGTCGSNNNCQYGYFCYQGFCRLPSCPTSADCSCGGPTPTPVAVTTPRTGFDSSLPSLILVGLGSTGLWMVRKFGSKR